MTSTTNPASSCNRYLVSPPARWFWRLATDPQYRGTWRQLSQQRFCRRGLVEAQHLKRHWLAAGAGPALQHLGMGTARAQTPGTYTGQQTHSKSGRVPGALPVVSDSPYAILRDLLCGAGPQEQAHEQSLAAPADGMASGRCLALL